MQLSCIIVEDDPVAEASLASLVQQTKGLSLRGTFQDAEATALFLAEEAVDLLLLDVELPGDNGLALLEQLEQPPMVILTTAYAKYALAAFDYGVIDFLLKPITAARFAKALVRAREWYRRESEHPTLHGHFFIRRERTYERVSYDDVFWIKAEGDYSRMNTRQGELMIPHRLKTIEEQLYSSPLLRIHRSYMVNVNYIQQYDEEMIVVSSWSKQQQTKGQQKLIPIGEKYRPALQASLKLL
jgi:DNA-binding LytR/AlgR family response regulator